MSIPRIITCAVVGAELTREQTPYLPLSPDEIAQSAHEAVQAGASIIHLHVRDALGKPTLALGRIDEVIGKIKKINPDVILQISTGGAVSDSFADRMNVLNAQNIEMASLTSGTTNFGDEVFLNPRPLVVDLAKSMQQKNIKPELEIFNLAMLEEGLRLIDAGLVNTPAHFDLVFGVPGAQAATAQNLDLCLAALPPTATASVAAIGRHQFGMLELALKKGAHVRVGMEDNIYLAKGVLAKSNAELVAKVAGMIKGQGLQLATPALARSMLGL